MKTKYIKKSITIIVIFLVIFSLILLMNPLKGQQKNFYFDYDKEDKVEIFEKGQINWTKNYILSKASNEISLIDQNNYSYLESIINDTGEEALENLFGIIRHIKIDDYRTIGSLLKRESIGEKNLSIIFKNSAKVLEPIFITNTKFEVTAKMPIYGSNSLSSAIYEQFLVKDDFKNKLNPAASTRDKEYSKIIIDVRGMGFEPAIFPRVFYEECKDKHKYINCEYIILSQKLGKILAEEKKQEDIGKTKNEENNEDEELSEPYENNDNENIEAYESEVNIESFLEKDEKYKIMDTIKKEQKLFYGPEYITNDVRETSYYIRYISDPYKYKDEIWFKYKEDRYKSTRLAYFTKALKVEGEIKSNIILSKADVDRFVTREENLEMILNGEIYILTD